MKLISWNIAGWVTKADEQVEALISRNPSIVCLQEVRRNSWRHITERFAGAGYHFFQDSVLLAEENNRVKGNMVISKFPVDHLPGYINPPRSESVLSVVVRTPHGEIKVHNAHIPNGSDNGWIKIETFEAIYSTLSREEDNPRILCGDFNSPQLELPNGATITWGQSLSTKNGVNPKHKDIRWHLGEYSVIRGLAEKNLPDVFRRLYGYEAEEYSYLERRKGVIVSKRRFDHVFSSQDLRPQECVYLHEFREMGLSDHSPIEVLFSPNIS